MANDTEETKLQLESKEPEAIIVVHDDDADDAAADDDDDDDIKLESATLRQRRLHVETILNYNAFDEEEIKEILDTYEVK